MNRYFKIYRASMKRLPKMETILEEIIDHEAGPRVKAEPWKMVWYSSRESDWDQWVDIDMDSDEPSTSPPEFKVTTARQ
jgi:hypothetical protein